jgi:hypothetical protein
MGIRILHQDRRSRDPGNDPRIPKIRTRRRWMKFSRSMSEFQSLTSAGGSLRLFSWLQSGQRLSVEINKSLHFGAGIGIMDKGAELEEDNYTEI